jgi:hypothetical protein
MQLYLGIFVALHRSKVMYSDQSLFKCIRASRTKVQRPEGASRYDSKYTVKTVKHPDSVMVWGCYWPHYLYDYTL